MSNIRPIEHVFAPPAPHMVGDGFRVHNFFPGQIPKTRMSPFFLLDYNSKIDFSPSKEPRGVGVHPHRGFETVTIAYHGKVAHHDSAGNSGVIGEGDVQWMTAASGLLHKEYHEKEFSARGGLFQMVQLWVNLPAKDKMGKPKYQEIPNGKMGRHVLDASGSFMEVIAGNYKGTAGPAFTFTPMEVYNARLTKGGKADLSFPAHYNTAFLVVEGEVIVNGKPVTTDHFILFKNEGTEISLEATSNAIVLILSGEPINEPIANYGPFVMNTWEELEQAVKDVNAGLFGVLED